MPSLYELTKEIQALAYNLELAMEEENIDGVFDYSADLEAIKLPLEEKLDAYVRWLKNIEAEETALKAEIDRLSARKKSLGRQQDIIKEAMRQSLIAAGEKKLKLPIATISRTKPRERIEVDTEQCLLWPAEAEHLATTEWKVNKTELKNFPGYEKLPGVTIVVGEEGLSIR